MSAPAEAVPTDALPAPAAASRPTTWWRRHRTLLIIIAGLLVAVVVTAVFASPDETNSDPLDPANPRPNGAQALARVLAEEGVEVQTARGADQLAGRELDESTTVVVTGTGALGASTLEDLRERANGAQVILVEPDFLLLEELGMDTSTTPVSPRAEPADCLDDELDAVFADLELTTDGATAYDDGAGCFSVGTGTGSARSDVALVHDGVTVFGAGEALSNDQILRGDNAAIALRLLGQQDRLVWYLPDLQDLAASEQPSLGALVPRWVGPALFLLLLAGAALVVWRARRLGALSTEPLPVVVKAIETTRSRGRLYRKAEDREHAAAALRAAARNRAIEVLRLGAGADEPTVVRNVADRTGRRADEIGFLIGSQAPPPPTDHDLIQLANALATLQEEVRRP